MPNQANYQKVPAFKGISYFQIPSPEGKFAKLGALSEG